MIIMMIRTTRLMQTEMMMITNSGTAPEVTISYWVVKVAVSGSLLYFSIMSTRLSGTMIRASLVMFMLVSLIRLPLIDIVALLSFVIIEKGPQETRVQLVPVNTRKCLSIAFS